MSEKTRRKKDGHDTNKERQAMREGDEFQARERHQQRHEQHHEFEEDDAGRPYEGVTGPWDASAGPSVVGLCAPDALAQRERGNSSRQRRLPGRFARMSMISG